MRKSFWIIFGLWFCGLLAIARADAFQLADGTSLNGDIVTFNDNGITLRAANDSYTNIAWIKLSQQSLKQLSANPKIKPLVEPFIEISSSERPSKPEIKIQEVSRLQLPPKQSLVGALFSSSVGLFVVLLIYAANLYAGFEIAVCRERPVGLVMGVSAVLPILGPVIFLSLPSPVVTAPVETQSESDVAAFAVPGQMSPVPAAEEIKIVAGSWQATSAPVTQTFQRGQFTFNRRFFETKFAGFFGATRAAAEKDLNLVVKSTKGEFIVERIARIGVNEVYFEMVQDSAIQEVMVPFADIQELALKPKTA